MRNSSERWKRKECGRLNCVLIDETWKYKERLSWNTKEKAKENESREGIREKSDEEWQSL